MREAAVNGDSYSKPVINLLTNPSGETAGATATVFNNFLLNPNSEGVASGTTFVRTNLCPDPASTNIANRFSWAGYGTGAAFTASEVTVSGMTRTSAYRWTATAASTDSTAALGVGPITTVVAGMTYTGSIDGRSSVAQNAHCEIKFFDASANLLLNHAGISAVLPANTVVRVSSTVTAPANAAKMQAILVIDASGTNWSTGDYIEVTATLIEQTDQYRPYFDGSTVGTTGYAYAWAGTANASTSTATCAAVTVRTNLASDPAATALKTNTPTLGWENTRWTALSTYSLVTGATDGPIAALTTYSRLTCSTANTKTLGWHCSSNVEGTGVNTASTFPVPWVAGTYVTLTAWFRTSNGTPMYLRARFADSGGAWLAAETAGTALGSGTANTWFRATVTTTVPTGAAYFAVNLNQSGTVSNAVGDTMDGTGLLVEADVASSGSYFDGNTGNFSDFTTAWSGTANASASYCYGARMNYWSLNQQYNYCQIYQHTQSDGSHTVRVRYPANSPSGGWRVLQGTIGSPTAFVSGGSTTFLLTESTSWGSNTNYVTVAESTAANGIGTTINVSTTATPTTNMLTVTNALSASVNSLMYRPLSTSTLSTTTEHYYDFVQGGVFAVVYTGSYFDGSTAASGDYTYTWTSMSNASTSNMRATTVSGTGVYNAVAVQSGDWAASGSKSLRVVATGTGADSFARIDLWNGGYVQQGKTYTVLATLRQVSALTGSATGPWQDRNIFLDINGAGGGLRSLAYTTPQTNAAGVYSHRLTFTVPAASAGAVTYFTVRFYNGHNAGGGDVWWDNIMLTEGVYNGPYIDGDQPGCIWTGTAHASTSKGYPPSPLLVNNTWPNAIPTSSNNWVCEAGTGGVASATYVTGGGPNNNNYVRYTWTTAASAGVVVGGAYATAWSPSSFPPGQTVTFSIWVRASVAFAGTLYCFFYPNGTTVSLSGTIVTLTPGVWTRVSCTGTIPVGVSIRPYIQFRSLAGGSLAAVGTTLDVTMAQTTLGNTLYDYTGPGWTYPLGIPQDAKVDTTLSTVGTSSTNLGATLGSPATSWYTVFNVTMNGTAGNVYSIVQYGDVLTDVNPNTYSMLRINQATSTTLQWFLRRTTGAGVSATISSASYAPGTYVICHGINSSGYQYISVNNVAEQTDNVVMQHASSYYAVQTNSLGTHIRTLAYPGAHSSATKSQIVAYLRNKYGA